MKYRVHATDIAGGSQVDPFVVNASEDQEAAESQIMAHAKKQGWLITSIKPIEVTDPYAPPEDVKAAPSNHSHHNRYVFVMAATALTVSIATAIFTWLSFASDGIDSYDFSTPEASIKSGFEIIANGDYITMLQLASLETLGDSREQRDTLKIVSKARFDGKSILFIEFKRNSILVREVRWLRKNPDSGKWLPAPSSASSITDQALINKIISWPTSAKDAQK